MKCPTCSSPVPDVAKFCNKCGDKVTRPNGEGAQKTVATGLVVKAADAPPIPPKGGLAVPRGSIRPKKSIVGGYMQTVEVDSSKSGFFARFRKNDRDKASKKASKQGKRDKKAAKKTAEEVAGAEHEAEQEKLREEARAKAQFAARQRAKQGAAVEVPQLGEDADGVAARQRAVTMAQAAEARAAEAERLRVQQMHKEWEQEQADIEQETKEKQLLDAKEKAVEKRLSQIQATKGKKLSILSNLTKEAVTGTESAKGVYEEGEHVEAQWEDGNFYPAVVGKREGDKYSIVYTDYQQEALVASSFLRPTSPMEPGSPPPPSARGHLKQRSSFVIGLTGGNPLAAFQGAMVVGGFDDEDEGDDQDDYVHNLDLDFDEPNHAATPTTKPAPTPAPKPAAVDDEYSLVKYGEAFLNTKVKKTFGSKTYTIGKLFAWAKKLHQPLHKEFKAADVDKAMKAFQLIYAYTSGKKTKDDQSNIKALVLLGLRGSIQLRDEIFCQLIKQSRHLSREDITERCWQLLCLTAGLFPCSNDLEPYLTQYLQRASSDVPQLGRYTLDILKQSLANGPRKAIPLDMELEFAAMGKTIGLKVVLPWGQEETVHVGSQTTVGEFLETIDFQLADGTLPHMPSGEGCFALYEVRSQGEVESPPHLLSLQTFVLDRVTSWTLEEERLHDRVVRETGKSKVNIDLCYEFHFRPRFFFYYLLKDGALSEEALQVYYNAGIADVFRGTYPTTDADCMTLSALDMLVKFPDRAPWDLKEQIEKYLPTGRLATFDAAGTTKEQVTESLSEQYQALLGMGVSAARRRALDLMMSLPLYGAFEVACTWTMDCDASEWNFEANTLRHANAANLVKNPRHISLGVSEKGILFISAKSRKLTKHTPLQALTRVGRVDGMFFYRYGDPAIAPGEKGASRVLVFKTTKQHASEVVYALNTYRGMPGFTPSF